MNPPCAGSVERDRIARIALHTINTIDGNAKSLCKLWSRDDFIRGAWAYGDEDFKYRMLDGTLLQIEEKWIRGQRAQTLKIKPPTADMLSQLDAIGRAEEQSDFYDDRALKQ